MRVHLNALRPINVSQAATHSPALDLEGHIQRFLGEGAQKSVLVAQPRRDHSACPFSLDSW